MTNQCFNERRGSTLYFSPFTLNLLLVTFYQLPSTIYQLPVFPLDNSMHKKELRKKLDTKNDGLSAAENSDGLVFQSSIKPAPGAGIRPRSGINPSSRPIMFGFPVGKHVNAVNNSFAEQRRATKPCLNDKQSDRQCGRMGQDRGDIASTSHRVTGINRRKRNFRRCTCISPNINQLWNMLTVAANSNSLMISRRLWRKR